MIILRTGNLVSIKLTFSSIQISLPNLRFLEQNHLALHKDRFLKKILLKKANTRRLFFTKLYLGSNNPFTQNENNLRFSK